MGGYPPQGGRRTVLLGANDGVDMGDVGIADGGDVAQGAIADTVVAAGAAGTLGAKLRRLTTDLSAQNTLIGALTAAIADAGGVGSVSAKLRRATQGLEDLKTLVVLAAGSNNIGDVDVLSTAITKTVETELLAITKVAANAQQKSSELALTNMKKVTILIDHGRTATTAFVVAGTEYRIEASQKAAGNDTWRTIASVEAIITAATEITADGAEAVGQTLIEIGANTPVVNDIVFWENATLADSEWMKVITIVGGTSFTILDGLTNAQALEKKIYNKGEQFVLTLDVTAFTRLRVVVNNNNGSTNVQVASRVAAITQV